MPYVSIGIPVYNGEKYVSKAIESILSQTFEDFELIISDNASTDKTPEICKAYVEKDKRVRYFRTKKNMGAAWNYNYVFAMSSGQYFKWASHDDICAPTLLERCLEPLTNDKLLVLCYPKTTIINEKGEPTLDYEDDLNLTSCDVTERVRKYVLQRSAGETNAVFGIIRSEILKETDLIKEYVASDLNLLFQLLLRGPFYEIVDRLFFRRDHRETSVRKNPLPEQRLEWFSSSLKRVYLKSCSPLAFLHLMYAKSIVSSPIGLKRKLICLYFVAKKTWWCRSYIVKEILRKCYPGIVTLSKR